jgi:hypothetical protein
VSQDDEFSPPDVLLTTLQMQVLEPKLRGFELEIGAPIDVVGHTAVAGVQAQEWHRAQNAVAVMPIPGEVRAVFRRTGDPNRVLYRAQLRVAPDKRTGWSGFQLGGAIVRGEVGLQVQPQGMTVLYHVHDWLPW